MTPPPINDRPLDRRDFLRGMAALPGLLPLCGAGLSGPVPRSRATSQRALILIWLDGGMSHIDTFDGKPDASPDIRGDLRSTTCAIDGVYLSEMLPRLGERMAECALIRSLSHGEGNHDRGSHYLLTGRRPSPVLVHPSLGSVQGFLRADESPMPAFVAIPDAPDYGGAGFLPAEFGPFSVGGDPARPDFRVQNLEPRGDTDRAMDLVAAVDDLDSGPRSPGERARDRFQDKATRMSRDPAVRAHFDLHVEPPGLRQRYGRHSLGQSCLLARKLVAAGTSTVLVRDRGWDHHQGIARSLGFGYPPKLQALDEALSALIDDLRQRELDDRVLVCVASEFGRTPRLNPAAGRDHWPRAQSVLLFGAGIARGVVVGRTDPRGEEPVERPVGPADLWATLLRALRIDADRVLHTDDGRPVRLIEPGGEPIDEVLAR